MKICLKVFNLRTLSTSAIPLVVATTCYLLEKTVQCLQHHLHRIQHPTQFQLSHLNGQNLTVHNLESPETTTIRQVREFFIDLYSNYMHFIATMLLLHLGMTIFKSGMKSMIRWHEGSSPHNQVEEVSKSTTVPYLQESWRAKLKTIGFYIFEIVVQYSLIFCICLLLCNVCQYGLYIYLHIFHRPGSRESESPIGHGQNSMSLSQAPLNEEYTYSGLIKHTSQRVLSTKGTPDIARVLATSPLPFSPSQVLINRLRRNDTEVLLILDDQLYSVSTLDMTLTCTLKASLGGNGFAILEISPNGQTILYQNSSSIFVANMSDLQSPIQLDLQLPDNYTFAHDSKSGFLTKGNILYQFKISSPEVADIYTLPYTSSIAPVFSPDGKVVIVASNLHNLSYGPYGGSNMSFINVADPKSPVFLNSILFNEDVRSLTISSDSQTLFIGAGDRLKIIDLSNLASIECCVSDTQLYNHFYDSFLLSPNEETLVLTLSLPGSCIENNVIDVSDLSNPRVIYSEIPKCVYAFTFLPDGGIVLMLVGNKLQLASFFVNLDLDSQVSFTSGNFRTTSTAVQDDSATRLILSKDGKTAIAVCSTGLETFMVSDEKISPNEQSSFIPYAGSTNIQIVPSLGLSYDGSTLFVSTCGGNGVYGSFLLINVTTGEYSSLNLNTNWAARWSISGDGKTLFYYGADQGESELILYTFDVANLTSLDQFPDLTSYHVSHHPIIADYGRFLVVAQIVYYSYLNISIYDISDTSAPVPLSSIKAVVYNDLYVSDEQITSIAVTPDNQTALVSSYKGLRTVDISNPQNITLLTFTDIIKQADYNYCYQQIIISGDSKTAFIPHKQYIQIVDISDRTNPTLLNVIDTATWSLNCISIVLLSSTSAFPILMTDQSKNINTMDLELQYAMDLPTSNFSRGEVTSENVVLLKRTSTGTYTVTDEGYKFVTISQYKITTGIASSANNYQDSFNTTYPPLPGWINFDKNAEAFTIAPTLQEDNGSYYIYAAVSTPVSSSLFADIATDPDDLMWMLLAGGYIDNKNYVTANFDPNEALVLPDPYKVNAPTIQQVLANNYFDMISSISVQSSLSLENSTDILTVSTNSQLPLTVIVSLQPQDNNSSQLCQFVTKITSILTPTFSSNNTVVNIIGPLFETNDVLANIFISSEDNIPCGGTINITDYLNPQLTRTFSNISQYFKQYQAPSWNLTTSLQYEINKTPLETGNYFIIWLQQGMFNETNLEISLYNNSLEWLTQTGFSFSGTPPEPIYPQFWPMEYNVTLDIRNEYKTLQMSFTLEVQMSWGYYFKLFLKLISVISLWVYFSTFSNILCKRRYRYPRDCPIKIDEPITPSTLFPVAFIEIELKESRFIIRELQKSIAKESNSRKVQLAEFFFDATINKITSEALFKAIEKVVLALPTTKRDRVKRYTSEANSRKELINQLILYEVYTRRLYMTEQKPTQRVFNQIKSKWAYLIEKAESPSWQFGINRNKLMHEIESGSLRSILPHSPTYTSAQDRAPLSINGGLEVELMNHLTVNKPDFSKASQIDLDLLEGALLAYAFRQQHMNVTALSINVTGKERSNRYFFLPKVVNQFFMFNLRPLLYQKGNKIGYGIKYSITDDVLEFYGTPKRNILDQPIVIQIISKRGRILREIWLHGVREYS